MNVTVHPTLTQPLNTPVWNYIYATKPASTPATICDENVTQSVQIASPFYVEGNLSVSGQIWILGSLIARGKSGVKLTGGSTVLYSSDAIDLAISKFDGQFVTLSWREK